MSHSFLQPLACAALALLLDSCTAPSAHTDNHPGYPGSSRLLGHKPGPQGFRTVILDAGHGGKDSGAVRNGLREKDYALDIVRRVERHLSGEFRVKQIRDADYFVHLDRRAATASRSGDILVSVHFNSGPSRLCGAETYYWRVDSYGLATKLHRELCAVTPSDNSRGLVRRRLRLTRNPTIPCVLVECGYLSNRREASLIKTESYRERIAYAIASGIRNQSRYGDGNIRLPAPRWEPLSRSTDVHE